MDLDCLAEVRALVTAKDFADADNAKIFQAVCRLADEGRTRDPTAVRLHMRDSGLLTAGDAIDNRMSGCIDNTPTADGAALNMAYYAGRVAEAAKRRRLVNEAERILYEAGDQSAHIGDILADLQGRIAEIAAGTVQSVHDTVVTVQLSGVDPEPITWLWPDRIAIGKLSILVGNPGLGKALDVATDIPTPSGWTTMGKLQAGDEVFGANGQSVRVIAVTDWLYERPCYKLTFSDHSVIIADANHEWRVTSRTDRHRPVMDRHKGRVIRHISTRLMTTRDIAATCRCGSENRANYAIACAAPVETPAIDLPIPPYVLGLWLGDGRHNDGSFVTADPSVLDQIERHGFAVSPPHKGCKGLAHAHSIYGLRILLRQHGLLRNKHVPAIYLRASKAQRLALLQGLMDTDGCITKEGRCDFDNTNLQLAQAANELIVSLGMQTQFRCRRSILNGVDYGPSYRVGFMPTLPVFTIPRKLARLPLTFRPSTLRRFIVSCRPVAAHNTRCIQVAAKDGMFLAGRSMIPTHNSCISLDIAARVSRGFGWPGYPASTATPCGVLLLSAEDDLSDTIRPRLDAAGADVLRIRALTTVKHFDSESRREVHEPFNLEKHLPMLEAGITQVENCRLIIIDPISAFLGRTDSHNNSEVRGLLAPLSELAAKHRIAVVAVSHLNKGDGNAINRVMGSMAFTAAARAVFAVVKDKDDPMRRLFLPIKNNLARDDTGFAYRLIQAEGNTVPSVAWEPMPVTMSADEAIEPDRQNRGPDPDQRREAEDWLNGFLQQGPKSAAECYSQAGKDGFTRATLLRAKAAAKIVAEKQGFAETGFWVWKLPAEIGTAWNEPELTPERASDNLPGMAKNGGIY